MSTEAVTQLLAAVDADTAIQEQLKAATSEKDLVRIAQEYGYHFTAEELWATLTRELSEEQLDSVAGGQLYYHGCKA